MIMKNQQKKLKNLDFCNWCNQPTTIIRVHGHGQCSFCGTNIDECCKGEVCKIPENPSNSLENERDQK